MFGQGFNYGFLGKPLCFTDTTDIFKDNSGVALYTLDYDASASDGGGKFGEAAKFNNTNSYVELPSTIDNPMRSGSAFTVSLWYKHAAQTNSYGGAIMKLLNDIYNLIDVETNGTIRARVLSSSSVTSEVTSSALTVGNWYHIVWTGNTASGVSLYINNSLIGNSAWDGTFLTYTNSNYKYNRLGYQNQSVSSLVGEIDQVRFFNRLVTSAEVSTLYNESKETTNTLQILGDSSCYATYTLNNNVNDLSGNYNATSSNLVYTNINGTPTNVDFGVSGKSLYGARFNGSNSYVDLPLTSIFGGKNTLAVSFWFKTTTTARQRMFTDYAQNSRNCDITIDGGNIEIVTDYGSTSDKHTTSSTYNDDNWHHIVVSINQSANQRTIYIDRLLVDSITLPSQSWNGSGQKVTIGAFYSSSSGYSQYFDGEIDQVRIFNKALSSSEVSKLYGNGAGEIACEYTATTTDINYPVANLAYYKLDNNSKDLCKTRGKFNQGATFVGNSTGIENSTLQLSSTAHSVSLWMKPQDIGSGKWQIAFGSYFSGGPTFTLGKRPDRTTSFHYRNESSNEVYFTLSTANIWYHIVVTRNNSGSTVYVNGSSVATDSNSMGSYSYSGYQKCVIGSMPNYPGEYFPGTIDQVRVYNVVLTATDVANLYNNETVSTANTLAFPTGKTAIATYKLDGDGVDISGNYSGVGDSNVKYDYSGTDTNIEYRFGRFGQAAVFNGSSSYISAGNPNSEGGARSFSAWIKTTSTAFQSIITNGGASHASGLNMFVYNNKLYSTSGKGNGENYGPTSGESINTGSWVHCVLTMSGTAIGSTLKTYVNGVLDGTHTTTILITDTYDAFRIGGRYINGSYAAAWFNGQIDQVRIFNSELTSSQVTQLYNEKPETDTNNFKAVLYKGNGATRYISSVGFEPSLTWFKARTGSYDHGVYDVLRGDGENYLVSNINSPERIPSSNSNYGYISSYDANGVFLGQGGNSNHPWASTNKSNIDYVAWNWKGGGLLNRSASFNGSNSKINFGNQTIFNSGDYSVSFWMNNKGNDSNAQIIFSQRTNSDSGSPIGIYFYGVSYGSYPGKLYFNVGGSYFRGDTTLLKNKWYHVVCTVVAGGAMKIYVNGVLDANSGTETTTRPTPTNQNFAIGSNGSNTDYAFNGNIDQVRIFNKAISSSEVTTLYNETASTINTLQVLGDTSCVAAYPLGVGAGDLSNTYSGTPSNVTFNNPGHLTRNNNGTIESTVSANTEAGFSIVKYISTGTSGSTVGHGLSSAPDIAIFKCISTTGNWITSITNVVSNKHLYLNTNSTGGTGGFSIDGTNITLNNTYGDANTSGRTYIAYCWHSVAGYSKIGSFDGDGTNDYSKEITGLGFDPSFVIVKNVDSSGSNWEIIDIARGDEKNLYANESYSENANSTSSYGSGKFITDGFKVARGSVSSSVHWNKSGDTYLYMAFK